MASDEMFLGDAASARTHHDIHGIEPGLDGEDHEQELGQFGLLSRTVVESPVSHWILRAQVRNELHNDIAFVGSHFVQITELQDHGQAREVLRKSDFGSRICSAAVLGEWVELNDRSDLYGWCFHSLSDNEGRGDSPPAAWRRIRPLPPQILVLSLESGTMVFLFMKKLRGSWGFITTSCADPRARSHVPCYLAVDPSSQNIVSASLDGFLTIHQLEAWNDLEQQYYDGYFRPIRRSITRMVHGVISQVAFLHPRPGEPTVKLLLIVSRTEGPERRPTPRIFVSDWLEDDALAGDFQGNNINHRLPDEHRMPTLLIPLTLQSSFLIISGDAIGLFRNSDAGPPEFEEWDIGSPEPTPIHRGTERPIWSAWSRPFRGKTYLRKIDIIYLAREDGAIAYIEIDNAGRAGPTVLHMGGLDTIIDTAFTAAYERSSDILIAGGTSGPGGIWALSPNQPLRQVSSPPCWAPAVDMTSTAACTTRVAVTTDQSNTISNLSDANIIASRADRLFSASGREPKGSITEWRLGFEARVSLDIEVGESIQDLWTLPFEPGLPVLLAFPQHSMLLQVSEQFDHVNALSAADTPLDLEARTLTVGQAFDKYIVQVTERSITIASVEESSQFELSSILGTSQVVATLAYCSQDLIFVVTHHDHNSVLHSLQNEVSNITSKNKWPCRGEATCITAIDLQGSPMVVVGSVCDGGAWICCYTPHGSELMGRPLVVCDYVPCVPFENEPAHSEQMEPLTSIQVVSSDTDGIYMIAGTRYGRMLHVKLSRDAPPLQIGWRAERVGVGALRIFPAISSPDGFAVFACCDDELNLMTNFDSRQLRFKSKHRVWVTESEDRSKPSPAIHSIASLHHLAPAQAQYIPALLLSRSEMFIVDVGRTVGHVPRVIPVPGTPNRVIYSNAWKCLISAVLKDNRPTLCFIDPDTGTDLARAVDKNTSSVDFISGLGQQGDRILGLQEWKFVKDGKAFWFILVATKQGNLIVVSVSPGDTSGSQDSSPRLQYWTRYKKHFGQPVYSIIGDDSGLVYCVGCALHWAVLDIPERRLRSMKKITLDSPATSLSIHHNKTVVLTTSHSVLVVNHKGDDTESGGMTLVHEDPSSRPTVHMIDMGDSLDDDGIAWPVTLMSEYSGDLTVISIPWEEKRREHRVLINGLSSVPIQKFVRARRPPMLQKLRRFRDYGTFASARDGTDVYGLSVDGALQHFTLLRKDLWRFLYSVQNLSRVPATNFPTSYRQTPRQSVPEEAALVEVITDPTKMQIDGDKLAVISTRSRLERVFKNEAHKQILRSSLDKLDGGRLTRDFKDMGVDDEEQFELYLDLACEILQYLLEPMM